MLIGLARAVKTGRPTEETDRIVIEGLSTIITNANFNDETIKRMTTKIRLEKCRINVEKFDDYDMKDIWEEHEDIRSLKSLILFGIRGMAAYAYHALVLGKTDDEVNSFFYKALYAIGEDHGLEELLPLVLR